MSDCVFLNDVFTFDDRKNMFMWSSLVFEIWGPKKYIFFIIGFQTSGSKTTKAPTLHGG